MEPVRVFLARGIEHKLVSIYVFPLPIRKYWLYVIYIYGLTKMENVLHPYNNF